VIDLEDHPGVVLQAPAEAEIDPQVCPVDPKCFEQRDSAREFGKWRDVEAVMLEQGPTGGQCIVRVAAHLAKLGNKGECPVDCLVGAVTLHPCDQASGYVVERAPPKVARTYGSDQASDRLRPARAIDVDRLDGSGASRCGIGVKCLESSAYGIDALASGLLEAFEKDRPSAPGQTETPEHVGKDANVADGDHITSDPEGVQGGCGKRNDLRVRERTVRPKDLDTGLGELPEASA
jgi:hypothetical protein